MQLLGWALKWLLSCWIAAVGVTGAADLNSLEKANLLAEIERLREEVQRMKASPQEAKAPDPLLQLLQPQPGPQPQQQGLPPASHPRDLELDREARVLQREITSARESLSRSALAQEQQGDRCMSEPLFAGLHGAVQKLALLEQDPVEASYQVHAAWEKDPSLFDVCPAGLTTALVYLSMAQEQDWKYRLLHRATYFLYSTPNLAAQLMAGRWPASDRLIRTMYHNSEVHDRVALKRDSAEAQPRDPGWAMRAGDVGVDEAVSLAMQHRDSQQVHFGSVLFYHFYHSESSPCACRTRSWCLPQWLRYFTNHSVDIWLAGRDDRKTLYRMDKSGCLRSLGHGLASHYFVEPFDLLFVFEVNAFMHPQCRIIPAHHVLLYPTFELTDAQMLNFAALGVSVLPDDGLLKPPNPAMRQMLDEATADRRARLTKPKDRLLIYPADIRPMKGQTDFLSSLLLESAPQSSSTQRTLPVRRLRGLTVVIAGTCDGNETYCAEVVGLSERVNADGIVNVVIADQLEEKELVQLYAAALGVVLHSRVDCNPRAIYEGLITDAPFFVTESTRLPPLVQHLGHISDGDLGKLPSQLADFVDFCEAGGFAGRAQAFAQRHLLEADVYREVVRWMELKYMTGKAVEPVIRSEDALAGPLAGLGSLLGAGATPGRVGLEGVR